MATMQVTEREAEQRDALVGRLFEAAIGTMDVFAVYLGDRLGLYQALADRWQRDRERAGGSNGDA